MEFEPASQDGPLRTVGKLKISMSATILINDGQHRRAAIEEAMRERSLLGDETISVVVFADRGLKRSQQMFADLNIHAVRPTKSIKVLYNHRDTQAGLSRGVIAAIPLFRDFTDLEHTSISNRSLKLFTLSSLHQATALLVAKSEDKNITDADRELAVRFWNEVIRHMPDWQRVQSREVASAELRRDYIHAHGVAVQAIAIAARSSSMRIPRIGPNALPSYAISIGREPTAKCGMGARLSPEKSTSQKTTSFLSAMSSFAPWGFPLRMKLRVSKRSMEPRRFDVLRKLVKHEGKLKSRASGSALSRNSIRLRGGRSPMGGRL